MRNQKVRIVVYKLVSMGNKVHPMAVGYTPGALSLGPRRRVRFFLFTTLSYGVLLSKRGDYVNGLPGTIHRRSLPWAGMTRNCYLIMTGRPKRLMSNDGFGDKSIIVRAGL